MAYDLATKKVVGSDFSCGLGGEDDVGSFVFPESDQNRLYAKLDDVQRKAGEKLDDIRYDVRRASSLLSAAVGALGGAVAMLGISQIWRAAKMKAT
jgi:hypothetical protein